MTDAKVDPAALAERLDQGVTNLMSERPWFWDGRDTTHMASCSEPEDIGCKYFQAVEAMREAAAALRQRRQERLDSPPEHGFSDASQFAVTQFCNRVTPSDGENRGVYRPQAPEERPDLIALENFVKHERRKDVGDQLWVAGPNKESIHVGDLLDRVLSALRAQPVTAARTALERTWQPIETAPKDGTPIDVWLGDADESDRSFYCPPGSRRSTDWHWRQDKWRPIMGMVVPIQVQPTHWMPLPAGPQARQEQE